MLLKASPSCLTAAPKHRLAVPTPLSASPTPIASSRALSLRAQRCAPLRVAEAEPVTEPAKEKPAPPAAAKKAKKDEGPQHWQIVLEELAKKEDRKKMIVVSIAPAVRVAMSEPFGLPPGAVTVGQIVTGLKQLGFDKVFDTVFAADLTIMEEGTELLHRLAEHLDSHATDKEPMPMFTSCCPGWVAMVEKSYPELIPYLSSCKSPQMMMGSVVKHFFAEEHNLKPADIVSCSVMPCVRKQGEADRPWFVEEDGSHDVDHVMTTDEVAKIFLSKGIDLTKLEETEFDNPLGAGSGAGVLFGTTGGVMEAALRTVYEVVTAQPMGRIEFNEVRGLEGIKATSLNLKPAPGSEYAKYDPEGKGLDLNIAVANGLGNAKKLITEMKAGNAKYDFIEVMACPSGCIGGGGQPRSTDKQILAKRQQAMYSLDERKTLRRSHQNPGIQELYKKFLGTPNSEIAHHLLHTHYVAGGPEGAAE
jgi:iron-only hydrogenase group A